MFDTILAALRSLFQVNLTKTEISTALVVGIVAGLLIFWAIFVWIASAFPFDHR